MPRPAVDETGPATPLAQVAPAGKVVISCVDPPITLAFMVGPEGIELTGGFGGWTEQPRPKRRAFMRYDGAPVWRQTANLIFDGWANNSSVEADVRGLERMALPRGVKSPPLLSLIGSAWRRDGANWLIEDLQYGDKIYTEDGTLLRQVVTITLAQQTSDDRIRVSRTRSAPAPAHTYRVRTGDTLHSIAAKQLGNANRAADIAKLNGIRDWRSIKVNDILKIPAK